MTRNYPRRTLRHRIPNILQISACERRCNVLGINVCETKIYELNMQKCLSDINYIRVNIVCSLVQLKVLLRSNLRICFWLLISKIYVKVTYRAFLLNLSTTATLGTEETGRCREVAVSGSLTVVEKSIVCEKNVLTIELTVSYFR